LGDKFIPILVTKRLTSRTLIRPRRGLEGNISIDHHRQIRCEVKNWVEMTLGNERSILISELQQSVTKDTLSPFTPLLHVWDWMYSTVRT
jgi:hypothetical protein